MENKNIYKRIIIYLEIFILVAIYAVLFYFLWDNLYEQTIQIPFVKRGNIAVTLIYPIFIFVFGKLFGMYNAMHARRLDLILSNVFTLLVVDVLMYFGLVVLIRHYTDPWPLVTLFIIESLIAVAWVIAIKIVNNKIFPKNKILLIHGEYSMKDLVLKVNQRSESYVIAAEINANEGYEKISSMIDKFDCIMISDLQAEARNDIMKYCYEKDKQIYILPKISDIIIESSDRIHIFDTTAFVYNGYCLTFDQLLIKRVMDIVVSSLMIIVTSWVMGLIALAIKLEDNGPVFYKQKRLTRNGVVFDVIKFRSMRVSAEEDGPQLSTKNDDRITKIGRLLRNSHLDELPQLFNVIKGEMSMVGPRPERPEIAYEYEKVIPEFKYRLKVKAGLTGYAQVYGYYNSTPYNKLRLDLTYIQNYRVWLDIKCIAKTVVILFRPEVREGIDDGRKNALK